MFLGVDGGGTKTAYVLIDAAGSLRARHLGPSVSHLAEGFDPARELLIAGIDAVLASAQIGPSLLSFSFLGLPAYGEDSATTSLMDAMPAARLNPERYRCGNDMICSWAGSLACSDGISVIAGTGSMAYGQYAGRCARCGGWGEIIGDEGSAYWIAREGMNLFSRMSDGRSERGPLYEKVRSRFGIALDLDLCAHIYCVDAGKSRSTFAQFAPLVHEAAQAGDVEAAAIFQRAAGELLQCVTAARQSLQVPEEAVLPVSHSGGVFEGATLLLDEFRIALAGEPRLVYCTPRYPPDIGAALYAACLAGKPLSESAVRRLSAVA